MPLDAETILKLTGRDPNLAANCSERALIAQVPEFEPGSVIQLLVTKSGESALVIRLDGPLGPENFQRLASHTDRAGLIRRALEREAGAPSAPDLGSESADIEKIIDVLQKHLPPDEEGGVSRVVGGTIARCICSALRS